MAVNPNYPRPKHARYLNASQFRVHEPVGMLTPTSTARVPGNLTHSKVGKLMRPYTHNSRKR